MTQEKPKVCPIMSRPMLSNGNIIQLYRVECLMGGCAFWKHGHKGPTTVEEAPNGDQVMIINEIPGRCRFGSA